MSGLLARRYVMAARSYLHVPWAHQGRTRMGLDCLGEVVLPATDCEFEVVDCKTYPREGSGPMLLEAIEAQLVKVEPTHMREGDVLLFNLGSYNYHLAIKTDYGIIYASDRSGKGVSETVYRAPWTKRLIGVYRFKELA